MKLKRPPAVKAILKQMLMFGFYILLLTYEIDSFTKINLFLFTMWISFLKVKSMISLYVSDNVKTTIHNVDNIYKF